MRKKIEELRNKEEGFTLVELLAVIVILGIIVAIAIPAIGNIMDNASTRADQSEEQLVADAARLYDIEISDWDEDGNIDISVLVEAGFLDERSGNNLEGTVTKNSGGTYTVNITGGQGPAEITPDTPGS